MAETAHRAGHDLVALLSRPEMARLTGNEEFNKVYDLHLLVWGQDLTELCNLL